MGVPAELDVPVQLVAVHPATGHGLQGGPHLGVGDERGVGRRGGVRAADGEAVDEALRELRREEPEPAPAHGQAQVEGVGWRARR